jgi:hypothetical protein
VTNFDTAGATSLLTTVEDLARWQANFDSPTVGGRALLDGLLTRGVLNDGRRIDYAFGITHGTYRGLSTIGHGGADAGYRSAILRFPGERFGVAVLCNLASANPTELAQRVADMYLAGSLKPVPTPDRTPDVPVPADVLAGLAGLYWNQAEALSRRFVVQNGRLHAGSAAAPPLKSLGEGRFVTTSGAPVSYTFEVGGNGSAPRVTVGPPGGPGEVLERAEPFVPAPAALAEFAGTYRSDEMDAVYRMAVRDGALRLERLKARPAPLTPLVADTFTSQPGTIRFVRDEAGRVNGFILDGGRVKRMKFWRER